MDRNETEKLPQNCYNYNYYQQLLLTIIINNYYQSAVSQENLG